MVGGWVDPIGKSPTKVFASLVAQWIDLRSPARHKTIYGYRDYREYGRTSIEPIERLKISEICVLPLPRATIYPHIFNSIWQNLCNNFCVGFQRLEDIGNAQIILQCNSKSRPVQGDREATGDCMLFSVNWWPWLEQLREEAHSGRDWLADEYWIATCLRKYWIATAPRLRKGPAEQGRKFKTWGKVCWLWAITRSKIQIYGKLALAGEKASALPSSGSGVSHWKRFLSALLYGRIFMWSHLWQQLKKYLQHSANTVGVKCDNSSSQICHFQKLPIHRIFSVILNLAIFNTIQIQHNSTQFPSILTSV